MARRIRPLTVERIGDLPDPCSACALWEIGGPGAPGCGPSDDADTFAEWISVVRSEWGDCGLVAYEGGDPLGFVKYAPPRFFPRAAAMPSGAPDEDSVLIACLHVMSDVRDVGLGKVMLQAALRDLVTRKEKYVEAYADADHADRERTPLMSVEFLLRQGFRVARPHPSYPLMRLELKSLVTWTDNLEAVLDAIKLPRGLGERVPAPLVNAVDNTKGSR
jgi:ribosomal protein S18 acetylase RimI-like enzyme